MRVVLTHDVDSVRKPLSHVLKVRARFRLRDLIMHLLGLTNLYDNIPLILELEEEVGVRSTFFIPVFLFPLELIEDELRELTRRGWEVGLHAVIERVQPLGLLRMQLEMLEEFVGSRPRGVRSHFLIADQRTLDFYAKLGFAYDSSLRVEEAARWDPYEVRPGLIELPIAVMDADLFGRFRLSEERAWRYILRKLERARQEGARTFVLLFHQESFRMRGGRLYRRLLWWLHEREFDMCTCASVYGALRASHRSSIGT